MILEKLPHDIIGRQIVSGVAKHSSPNRLATGPGVAAAFDHTERHAALSRAIPIRPARRITLLVNQFAVGRAVIDLEPAETGFP